jgi:ribosomal protein S1
MNELMDDQSWECIKSKYKIGQILQGKVIRHTPYGVFLDIGEVEVKGLIRIPDFLDDGAMNEEMYPEIGSQVTGVVTGYNEANRYEVCLNAKPSILHQALVPLKGHILTWEIYGQD